MNEHLNYLMQQLVERKRRDASLEAYRQEVQGNPAAARPEASAGYANMLRDMKGEAAPEAAPPYIAEPEITQEGTRQNAYRQALYGITAYL